MEIDRGGMLKLAKLLADLFDHGGMAMPHRHCDDSRKAVEILLAGLVPEVLHVAFDHEQRLTVVSDEAGCEVLATKR